MGYVTTPVDMPRAEVLEAKFELKVNGAKFDATPSFRPFYDPESERTKL